MIRGALIALLFLVPALAACSHSISVNTTPPGATVRLVEVGGEKKFELGESPVTKTVSGMGAYVIIAEKSGYAQYRKRIDLGEQGKYDIELVPEYELEINSEPAGANIALEDRGNGNTYFLGKAPLRHIMEGKGPFFLKATMEGYKAVEQPLDARPGQKNMAITIKMAQ